jgi:phosphoribosyl-ATP pyrophosphohydrolase
MGYHTVEIHKGVYGEFSKINEEIEELLDAVRQDSQMLVLCELCDLIGAIEGYTLNKHNITLDELIAFKDMTKSAFLEGKRK